MLYYVRMLWLVLLFFACLCVGFVDALTEPTKFSCVTCSKFFPSKAHVSIHMRVHTGEKPFKCDFCPERFIQNNALQRHVVVHERFCDYACDQCSASYERKGSLTSHQRCHGEIHLVCSQCAAQFPTSKALNKHYKIEHPGEKVYQCGYCGYAAKRQSDLTVHERRHTGEKPYKCDQCLSAFVDARELRCHKRRMHSRRLQPSNGASVDDILGDFYKLP